MKVRELKEQYQIKDQILKERLEIVLPKLMKETDIDLWLIPSNEYNEDPIFTLLTPSAFPTARRTSLLLFSLVEDHVDCYSLGLPDEELNKYYKPAWDKDKGDQMSALAELIDRLAPHTIGLNYSDDFAYCDGLSVGLFNMLKKSLPAHQVELFKSAQLLGIRLLETRTPLELSYYPEVMDVAMKIIDQVYNKDVIKPGVTTCSDVEWQMKEAVNRLGLTYWFEPTIDVQRPSGMFNKDTKIEKGDLVHCDFGITYLNLCTDTQRLAYVLKDGEDKLPEVFVTGMKQNNQFQDIVTDNFKVGLSGNEVFTQSLKAAEKADIKAMLYTHPLGLHGHAAGPTIGLFSDQKPQPIKGDLLLNTNTAYALELNTRMAIAGYEKEVFFFTEESVVYKDGKVSYLADNRDVITLI